MEWFLPYIGNNKLKKLGHKQVKSVWLKKRFMFEHVTLHDHDTPSIYIQNKIH